MIWILINNIVLEKVCISGFLVFLSIILFIIFQLVQIALYRHQLKKFGETPIITTKIYSLSNGVINLAIRNDSQKSSKMIAHAIAIDAKLNGESLNRTEYNDEPFDLAPRRGKLKGYTIKTNIAPESELIIRVSYNPVWSIFKTTIYDIFVIKENGDLDYWNKRHCEFCISETELFDNIFYKRVLDCCPDDSRWWPQLIDAHDYLDKYRYFREV